MEGRCRPTFPNSLNLWGKTFRPWHPTLLGGLMWLDHKCNTEFGTEFKSATLEQQKQICDAICWHDTEVPLEEQPLEIQFFYLMRGLTVTGYYTSKVGIADLGYKGNMPNVWTGFPKMCSINMAWLTIQSGSPNVSTRVHVAKSQLGTMKEIY